MADHKKPQPIDESSQSAPKGPATSPLLLDCIHALSENIGNATLSVNNQIQSAIQNEISKMRESLEAAATAILQAAIRDHKTPLFNERALHAKREIVYPEGTSIFSGDINDFKSINDDIGPEEADFVIHSVGSKLEKIAKQLSNTEAFRRGGDEFVIISPPECDVLDSLLRQFINHNTEVSNPKKPDGPVKVTVVFGRATLMANETFLAALKRADAACKAGKWQFPSSKENVVEWSPELQSGSSKRVRCNCGAQYNATIPPNQAVPSHANCWACNSPIAIEPE